MVLIGALALVVLATVVLVTSIANIAKRAPSDFTHKYSRPDLRADAGRFRRIAATRAHGAVRGPSIRRSGDYFVLTYRRGRRCRVVINVLRAPRYLNGGAYGVLADGCP